MKKTTHTILIGTLLLCNAGFAQVSQQPAEAEKVWGIPQNGKLDASESGVLQYQKNGATVFLHYVHGICMLADYKKSALSERDIDSLLRLNNGNTGWKQKPLKNHIESDNPPLREWMRSDKSAIASLYKNQLRVRGNQKLLTQTTMSTDRKRPEKLPALGTSVTEAVAMLGQAERGEMQGDELILYYPWGLLRIADNKVSSIQL